jgi:hypothetical protein
VDVLASVPVLLPPQPPSDDVTTLKAITPHNQIPLFEIIQVLLNGKTCEAGSQAESATALAHW